MPGASDESWETRIWGARLSICFLQQMCSQTSRKTATSFVIGHFTLCCFIPGAVRGGSRILTERFHQQRKFELHSNRHDVKACSVLQNQSIHNGHHSNRFSKCAVRDAGIAVLPLVQANSATFFFT